MDTSVHTHLHHHQQPHPCLTCTHTDQRSGQPRPRGHTPQPLASAANISKGARVGAANRWALQQQPPASPLAKNGKTRMPAAGVTRYSSTWVAECLASAVNHSTLPVAPLHPQLPPPLLMRGAARYSVYCTLLVAPTHPGTRSMYPLRYQGCSSEHQPSMQSLWSSQQGPQQHAPFSPPAQHHISLCMSL